MADIEPVPLPNTELPDWTPFSKVAGYYGNPRQSLLDFVPNAPKNALDVGCGAGAFGLMVRSHFGCRIWGIELMEEPARLAAERLDRVYHGEATKILPRLPEAAFDLVSFNDVLEHLPWPQIALRHARRLLAPGGVVLASLPNLRYWSQFRRLLVDGDFPQEDSGVFDRTHLRWYTKKSIPRLFSESGFRVARLEGLYAQRTFGMRLLNKLLRNKLEDTAYLQYIVVAEVDPQWSDPGLPPGSEGFA